MWFVVKVSKRYNLLGQPEIVTPPFMSSRPFRAWLAVLLMVFSLTAAALGQVRVKMPKRQAPHPRSCVGAKEALL